MRALRHMLCGARAPRGLSAIATLLIAVLVIIVAWSLIRPLIFAVVTMLRLAVEIGVLIVAVLLIAWLVKVLSKKVQ